MKIVKRAFWAVIGLVLFFSTALAAETKKNSSIKERMAILQDWMAAGKNVATVTGDENGKAIMDFLRDSQFLAIPEKDESPLAFNMEGEPKASRFQVALIPVLAQDEKAGSEWKKLYERNQAATFIPGPEFGVIVLKKN